MSRTTITEVAGAGIKEREALRVSHQVRLVEPALEGTAALELPDGVYGFTYSPAIAAPLFRDFRYQTFEMHRRAGGEAVLIGFVTAADAAGLRDTVSPSTVTLYHDREGDADVLVVLPLDRIIAHRQYAVRNTAGIELKIHPA